MVKLKKLLLILLLTVYSISAYASTYYLVRRAVTAFYTYDIAQSARFNDDDSAYMLRTPGVEGDRRTWTLNTWLKRGNLGSVQYLLNAYANVNSKTYIRFEANDKFSINNYLAGAFDAQYLTNQVFRDPTSWYNFHIIFDSTDGTAGDRIKLYINGVRVTSFSTANNPALNVQSDVNMTYAHYISRDPQTPHRGIDGYLAQTYLIDGSVLAPTIFGEFKNNIWIAKDPGSLTYGTNGFLFDYSNSAHFGDDQSGLGNDFTDSGLATNDQVIDTPTDNYCTLNPISRHASVTLSNGNLNGLYAAANWLTVLGTKSFISGKRYAEATVKDTTNFSFGVSKMGKGVITEVTYIGDDTDSWGLLSSAAGQWQKAYNAGIGNLGGVPAINDVIQVAVDADAGKVWFGVNNVWFASGDPAAGTNECYSGLTGDLTFGMSANAMATALECNFGQLGFTYTPPTGFKALNSSNMDDPTIMDSSDGCVTDSDTGANIPTTLAALRSGWTNYIDIYKNLSNIESWDVIFSDDATQSLHFDANDAKGAKQALAAGDTYTGVSLRVGTAYGIFTDEVSHTNGADTDTAHSLGSATVGIVKLTNIAGSWYLVHPDLTASRNLVIDTNVAEAATVYAIVDNTNITVASAAPTGTYRVLAIKEITGYNSVGVWTGNGNADGPYANSGGRVAVGIYKNKDDTDSWIFLNDERLGYNVDNNDLNLDTDAVEGTADYADIVSQGLKVRSTNAEVNTNAEEYIKIEWFAQPGKYNNAR